MRKRRISVRPSYSELPSRDEAAEWLLMLALLPRSTIVTDRLYPVDWSHQIEDVCHRS